MAMMDQALNDERAARQLQQNLAAVQNAERQRLQTNAQNQVNRMIANIARKQTRIGVLLREKIVFQLVIRQRDQNILILQQQILAIQNIPPGNIAAIQDVMNAMAPLLSQIPQYIGQEPPDDYFNKVMQVFTYGTQLGVAGFNDAIKTNILAGKMAGKFTPPQLFNNAAAVAVVTPVLFIAWLRDKYREV